ncbi:MAG TPA: HupE/UreJ family protein [Bryobacteraceae bacterium]|jgi:hypothetical protein
MWRSWFLLMLAAVELQAHVVSMSTGELTVDGPTATFELRMPMFEVAHAAHPETELLAHVHFEGAKLTHSHCQAEDSAYVCRGDYEFARLPKDSLAVECTLYQVTVPNHVHLLTATRGANTDQLVFDQRFTSGEVRFHPPSRAERIAREFAAGGMRALRGAAGMLFLIAMALASRSRAEALSIAAVFLVAEWAARPLGPLLPVTLSVRFLEAVLALTVAYLAVEVLLLPEGRFRWMIVAVLGLCHGLSYAGFPATYLSGAEAVQVLLWGMLAAAAFKMPRSWLRPAAALLLASALGWFALSLV